MAWAWDEDDGPHSRDATQSGNRLGRINLFDLGTFLFLLNDIDVAQLRSYDHWGPDVLFVRAMLGLHLIDMDYGVPYRLALKVIT